MCIDIPHEPPARREFPERRHRFLESFPEKAVASWGNCVLLNTGYFVITLPKMFLRGCAPLIGRAGKHFSKSHHFDHPPPILLHFTAHHTGFRPRGRPSFRFPTDRVLSFAQTSPHFFGSENENSAVRRGNLHAHTCTLFFKKIFFYRLCILNSENDNFALFSSREGH